ncbi:DUF3105 domain-containing protein [Dactylosporangium sp. NPDC051484]|uniref:DUF3105 domain-containing protein n=1 Tax=Dactylosporangium sp. NPDC051484 TaxID=3154942 RepID=UPI00344E1E76
MSGAYPQPPPSYGTPPYQPSPYQPPSGSNRRLVIALVSIVGVLALACVAGIVGVVWYTTKKTSGGDASADIAGLIDYRSTHPEWLERDHRDEGEKIEYPMVPAAGGPHHPVWERCAGDVYTAPVDEGNAVHSLEHGAVWITYRAGLAPAEVERLAKRVRNNNYMLMSPYDGQPTAISLQAWGYQLRVTSADDPRIDAFIREYRQTATLEPGVPCSTGGISSDASAAPSATG